MSWQSLNPLKNKIGKAPLAQFNLAPKAHVKIFNAYISI